MFYISDDSGALDLTVGFDGLRNIFVYGDFDFRGIIELSDWEPIALAICDRRGFEVQLAMNRLHQGITAESEVDAFYEVLNEQHSDLYYDLYRPLLPLDGMRREMALYYGERARRAAKKLHTTRRRAEFNLRRDDLVLKMLDAGVPYLCGACGCVANTDLTVDHILALSRGGTDALENLQFLCRPHNSEKGDRDIAEFRRDGGQ